MTPPNPGESDAAGLTVEIDLPLDRFALQVHFSTREQVTGIFGASGSGKTSILESVAGLRKKVRGKISFGNATWVDSASRTLLPPEARDIGYVPQDGLLFPHKNVRENLLAGSGRANRTTSHPLEETLAQVVDLLELVPLLQRRVDTLSGGERQRVALGRAICSGPRLLLLDEPLASLDLRLRRKLLPFLRRVREEFRIPMILVSHDPLEVQALCDDLIVIDAGRIIAHGKPREVLTDPEIFPLAEREGFENLLPGIVVKNGVRTSQIEIGGRDRPETDPILVSTVPAASSPGESLLVGIPAHEIMIATQRPVGLSARNVLKAEILDLKRAGAVGLVVAQLGPSVPPLTVEVTETTIAELGLSQGRDVFLVLKATSCRIYEGARSKPSARE